MLKLVIVGQDQNRLNTIKCELSELHQIHGDLRVSTTGSGFIETLIEPRLKVLIFDTGAINKMVFPFMVKVRKLGFAGPIIILGNPGDQFDIRELDQLRNVFHLGKPYAVEALLGVTKNCINIEKMRQRRDQRFDVREQATLEAYSSDFRIQTVINNISRSGVRIEGDLKGLKQGDLLRLHLNLDKINKERTMSARVVWMEKAHDNKEQAGLEFVSQKAVYRFLQDYGAA